MKRDIVKELKNYLNGTPTQKVKVHLNDIDVIEYKEGDVWEENGKKWTIKNGIKKTVSRLSEIRNNLNLPYTCPKCNQPMEANIYNKKMYSSFGICYDCVIKRDTEMIINGTFNDYQKEIIYKNAIAWFKQCETEVNDFLENLNVNQIITEEGQIEDWSMVDTNSIKEYVKSRLDDIKKEIEDGRKNIQ